MFGFSFPSTFKEAPGHNFLRKIKEEPAEEEVEEHENLLVNPDLLFEVSYGRFNKH